MKDVECQSQQRRVFVPVEYFLNCRLSLEEQGFVIVSTEKMFEFEQFVDRELFCLSFHQVVPVQ